MTVYVLDLSNNQGGFDAQAVKAAGYSGVILKATEGVGFVDATFRPRAQEAHAAGLVVGAYAFCHPGQNAGAQAQAFNDVVASAGVPVPIRCADIEVQEGNVDAFASAFCPAASINLLYSGAYFSEQISTPIPGVEWWLAAYGSQRPSPPWGVEAGWQFTDSANVPGSGQCDESIFDDARWAELVGGLSPSVPTSTEEFFMPIFANDDDADRWFVRQTFNEELGREPTAEDQTNWVQFKRANGADLTLAGIRDSEEAQAFRAKRGW